MQVVVIMRGLNRKQFANTELDVKMGDYVIFESDRGSNVAKILACNVNCQKIQDENNVYNTIKKFATSQDIKVFEENLLTEKNMVRSAQMLADREKLDMKIISAELNLDKSKVVVNFISDNRVDFRNLVKELASQFKMRIELRQIGARDEAKIIGGLGPCGRQCCCKLFLDNYEHATIKMAKVQGLSLNPTKISGLCGRLMCCLAYENPHYNETFKQMPRINSEVETKDGKGVAVYNNILAKLVQVKFKNADDSFEIREYPLEDIKVLRKNAISDVEDAQK